MDYDPNLCPHCKEEPHNKGVFCLGCECFVGKCDVECFRRKQEREEREREERTQRRRERHEQMEALRAQGLLFRDMAVS